MTIKTASTIFTKHIKVEPETGSHIVYCLRDCAKLALKENAIVTLTFNGTTIDIDPN